METIELFVEKDNELDAFLTENNIDIADILLTEGLPVRNGFSIDPVTAWRLRQ